MNSTVLYLARIVSQFLPETRCFQLKRMLYRRAGANIGDNVRICSSACIMGTGNLSLGDNTWVGHGVTIVTGSNVEIGRNVDIAPNVFIGTGSHEIDLEGDHIAGRGTNEPIHIGDGAWICASSTILPGVSIGKKSVVAAGSVVNRSVEAYELVGGIPIRTVKILKTVSQ